jgi:ATP-dependent Clp protease ATP-binding subunit ClpA
MSAAGAQRNLDTTQGTKLSKLLLQQFSNKVVGQTKATTTLIDMMEAHISGISNPTRPVGVALFLGPTGTGKTHVVETFAESLFGSKNACIRIDCAEFQHSHEIAKLIGSPPGYLGHRETKPALTQEALDKYHTASLKLSILLFDEIEKASDALWSLLLGILDNATITCGDNSKVNFSNTLIVMTSNLGARDMSKRGIGFADLDADMDDARKERVALSAAKSKFTPEFMNRIQHFITFKTLTSEQISGVLEMTLKDLEFRLALANNPLLKEHPIPRFTLAVSPKAKKTLIAEGFDPQYGARHLLRTVERRIQIPLSRLLGSQQIREGDTVIVDDTGGTEFDFFANSAPTLSGGLI